MKMKKILLSLLALAATTAWSSEKLTSGNVTMNVDETADGKYKVSFAGFGQTFNDEDSSNPTLCLTFQGGRIYANYNSVTKSENTLTLKAEYVHNENVTLLVTDIFTAKGDGAFSLNRSIDINTTTDDETTGFYSSFGLHSADATDFENLDKFIPAVLYNACFTEQGNMPAGSINASDKDFQYRDDRITLPVVMMRDKNSGVALTIINTDSPSSTIINDASGIKVSQDYQYGGVGITLQRPQKIYTALTTWPGNDTHAGGLGSRYHPLINGGKYHKYSVYFKIEKTDDYATSVSNAWNTAFDLYNPTIYETDLKHAYDALINTLDYYYLSPIKRESKQDVTVTAPGFPWSIKLNDFSMDCTTYELGFVGLQPSTGLALMRAGIDSNNADWKKHGTDVIDFWAQGGLSTLGFPKSRFRSNTEKDKWEYTECSMRQACSGFTEVLEAWCLYRKTEGVNKVKWIEACKKFGDWLVENQNEDGSYYMEYQPYIIKDGKHPAGKNNKNQTICAVRYLVELYIATNEQKYLDTAIRAAEWAYENNHKNYAYVACVIDNPQYVDSESGQQALQGFLSIYDLTKEQKWLDAAIQSAKYTEIYTYMHEVPVEIDRTEPTLWPSDKSIVGQHNIAAAHSASDLGFAWTAFQYFHLYVITGDEHWLKVARIAAHNTKQSMNLYQELFPGQPEGLQMEAFTIRTSDRPRRTGGVFETLNWNFAAHLDPMNRLIDAYGSPDIEEIVKIPFEELKALDEKYSIRQSADYGDSEEATEDNVFNGNGDGITGEYWEGSSDFGNPIPAIYRNTDFHKSPEQDQPGEYRFTRVDPRIDFDWDWGNPFNTPCDDESFSVKWTGYLLAPVTARYTFNLVYCDDAFSFKLYKLSDLSNPIREYDNEYIGQPGFGFNWDKPTWKINARLEEGEFYYLELLYFENAGTAHINLRWSINGVHSYPTAIPQSQLYSKLPEPDGITDVEQEPVCVFSDDGKLHILDAHNQLVSIYTPAGECVKKEVMSGNKCFSLDNGIYIVRIGSKAMKVAMK